MIMEDPTTSLTSAEREKLFNPAAHVDSPPLACQSDKEMSSLQSALDFLTLGQRETLETIVMNIANERGNRALDTIREEITRTTEGLPDDQSTLNGVSDPVNSALVIGDEYADAIDEAFESRLPLLGCW
ncbi:hypothetical protein GCM10009689_17430 [Brevibacterium antiquum]|uniref:hypothetical protein n=1 Tax=Brevibacterium antiquum TaxID=234835 RepID=UPI0018DF1934|nr:hypothetical protein [Brevibacterium antiquum]